MQNRRRNEKYGDYFILYKISKINSVSMKTLKNNITTLKKETTEYQGFISLFFIELTFFFKFIVCRKLLFLSLSVIRGEGSKGDIQIDAQEFILLTY